MTTEYRTDATSIEDLGDIADLYPTFNPDNFKPVVLNLKTKQRYVVEDKLIDEVRKAQKVLR